jgi:hypothetical protein
MSCASPAVLDDVGRLAFAGVEEVAADGPVEAGVRCLGGIVRARRCLVELTGELCRD